MIKPRQKLGKYRIERKLGEGAFAAVYRAQDVIEGVRVALKIPYAHLVNEEVINDFRREVRLVAGLKHPHILPLKNAEMIDGQLVLAFPLGERTLAERLHHRLSSALAVRYSEQLLAAVSFAHEQRIIHCDIKPENLILFPDNQLLLTDFGIAKVALRTIRGSGSGTVGYVAPEQALGKPSFRSDVFSIGLIIYRMFSGHLPEWPYDWPPPGFPRIRERLHPDFVLLLRRALELDPRKRFPDATAMLASFRRSKPRMLRRSGAVPAGRKKTSTTDWRTLRFRQFRRRYGRLLQTRHTCPKCGGPVSEPMSFCPWCGIARATHDGRTEFPQSCPRCHRGMKLDWRYCPWCFGPGFEVTGSRQYPDARYQERCSNAKCPRRELMPFMRYCPWCRRKVRRKWNLADQHENCGSCGWGVAREFWEFCPWCGTGIA